MKRSNRAVLSQIRQTERLFIDDGQFFRLDYPKVIHGYCCGLALNNPWLGESGAGFFAKRDGRWVYVRLEVK